MPPSRLRVNADSPGPDRRQLTRSRESRAIAGVAGGLGTYFGIDPVIVRVALVVLALMTGGLFLIFYVAAIWIIPKESKTAAAERTLAKAAQGDGDSKEVSRSSLGASVLIGVGFLALSNKLGLNVDGDFLWPLAFIGFGVAVLWSRRVPSDPEHPSIRDDHRVHDDNHPFRTLVDSPIVQRAYDRAVDLGAKTTTVVGSGVSSRAARRSWFPMVATAGFAVLVGLSWMAWQFLGFEISLRYALSIALVVLGLLMFAGSWFGRPKLLSTGVLLTVFLAVISATGIRLNGGIGEQLIEISSAGGKRVVRSEVYGRGDSGRSGDRREADQGDDHLDIGSLVIDSRPLLASPAKDKQTRFVAADVGIGELRFVVAPDVTVVVDAAIGMGALIVDDTPMIDGVDRLSTLTIPASREPKDRARRTLRIRSRVGIGVIRIDHLDPAVSLEAIDTPEKAPR